MLLAMEINMSWQLVVGVVILVGILCIIAALGGPGLSEIDVEEIWELDD